MAGRGPTPKTTRRNKSDVPIRGDWAIPPGVGWQHGKVPARPPGLLPASRSAWTTWFKAWFAAYWGPEDLPALRKIVQLHDQVERGEYQRSGELRLWMDDYGLTKKGQQDRRWAKPRTDEEVRAPTPEKPKSKYGHLRAVESA